MDNLAFLHQAAVERASEDDRLWFEANPDRKLRLRDAVPMELNGPLPECPPGYSVRTVVVQFRPGVRSRTFIGIRADMPSEGAEDHHIEELIRRYAHPEAQEKFAEIALALRKAGV
jgi:hypothetical protein